jgi:hypothetical protein
VGGASPEPSESCPAYRRVPVTPFDNKPILAQSPASPAALASSRVAAYNADVTQSTTAPAPVPQTPAQPTTAVLASQPVIVEPPQAQSGSWAPAEAEPAFGANTLHNVDQSGKSDRIPPKPAGQ